MYKYWLNHAEVWADFWSVRHIIILVHPAGVTLREVGMRWKSSLQAQVPARLQPFPYCSFPPLSLLKTHPASLNVRSHHHDSRVCTLFAKIQDGFLLTFLEMQTQVWGGHEDAVFPDEYAASWPITLHVAILRHVLPTGQGYPEFIQQQVASFMPWREVKRSPVWAPCRTVDEQTHTLSLLLCAVKLHQPLRL